jgi:23S rRNA (adenine1618-N6)-methyltransferase
MSTEPQLLHPNNPHQGRYDLKLLCQKHPALLSFIQFNPTGQATIDFSHAQAVQTLNAALLACYYQVNFWQLPAGYLCPPIPGRADYLHYAKDLVADLSLKKIRMLDIGCGANCIYPILASRSFGWQVVGTEIDKKALKIADTIINANKNLQGNISLRQQKRAEHIFQGVVHPEEFFALTVCNPPFYGSAQEAAAVNQKKWQKLGKSNQGRNFAGSASELWCDGGELAFISKMIAESKLYAKQVGWFTTLVSQRQHHKPLLALLKQYPAVQIKQQKMQQGQKTSLLLAWRFTT